ncbi:SpoIIE family protein phosphatase [Micromonospora sp. BRA006-A]|nr:SpoIIE family protein phosphatase [Micromonospora sp. BRA006-A]
MTSTARTGSPTAARSSLGDVSGKGVEAAVFTGQLRQCLQALHRVETQPGRLLKLLNDALLETTQAHGQGRFATLVLGVSRPHRDGGLTLTLAGGGHLPPLVLRESGEVEVVRVARHADRRGARSASAR